MKKLKEKFFNGIGTNIKAIENEKKIKLCNIFKQ